MLEADKDKAQLLGDFRLRRKVGRQRLGGRVDDIGQGGEYALDDQVGHHVQNLMGVLPRIQQAQRAASSEAESNALQVRVELQADCFAGAYMGHAADSGLVSPAAVTQAMQLTQAAGDVWFFLPHDAPAHGTKSERALAFMTGMNGDVTDCGFGG